MTLLSTLREDLQNARAHDPASRGDLENALVYSGLRLVCLGLFLDEGGEHRDLEPIERRHYAAAQSRAKVVDCAEREQDECGEGSYDGIRDGDERLDVGHSAN